MDRETIAAWMREAGRIDVALARMNGAGPGAESFAEPWEQRAARVEAMRCETCAKGSHGFMVGHIETIYGCPWYGCGGCFHHEERK